MRVAEPALELHPRSYEWGTITEVFMSRHGLARFAAFLVFALSCTFASGQNQETVYRHVASDKLEAVLKDLSVVYQKSAGKKDGIFIYDYESKGVRVRLFNYGGEDLWIESDYTEKATLDVANRWNMRAKFSRAVLVKEGATATISLEAQIDCTLGITQGMMREFIRRFDGEIQAFGEFLKK
jgi:hypothetical protein